MPTISCFPLFCGHPFFQKDERFIYVFHTGPYVSKVTLAIPRELYDKMKSRSEIKWSEVIRKSISEKIDIHAPEKLGLGFRCDERKNNNAISDTGIKTVSALSDSMEDFFWKEKQRLLRKFKCNTIEEVIQKLQKILDEK